MNENRSATRRTYAWVTEADAQVCRDALKKAGYIIDENCVTPNNNDDFSHQVFGASGWVSYAERVGVIQFPSDEEMLRPRDSHREDALMYAVGGDGVKLIGPQRMHPEDMRLILAGIFIAGVMAADKIVDPADFKTTLRMADDLMAKARSGQ